MNYQIFRLIISAVSIFLTAHVANGGDTADSFGAFYTKTLDAGGIAIRAHRDVSDEGLREAKQRLDLMLGHLPTVRANLVNAGAEVHIIGKDQVTSDLPENAGMKGKPFDGKLTVDERTRGLGGLWTSCGEENLLRLPKDRYFGRDILVHEFAHCILNNGTSTSFREQVEQRLPGSLSAKRWVKSYAGSNADEFFAELSMWYFGTHGDLGMEGDKPQNGRDGLRNYDAEAFTLLDDFYQGRIEIPERKFTILKPVPIDQLSSIRASDNNKSSKIVFHNQTSQTLLLYWVDFEGRQQRYGDIPPHTVRSQSTFSTHPWLCSDEHGNATALFVAQPGDCLAKIELLDMRAPESNEAVNLAVVATASSSYVSGDTSVTALNDDLAPRNSRDNGHGSYGNWPHTGTQWVEYDWPQPISTKQIEVYWWDDRRGVHLPKACRVKFWNGEEFVAVQNAHGLGIAGDQFNVTTFDEVTTSKLRLEMDSDGSFSTGILEWRVLDSGKSPTFPPRVNAGAGRDVI